ncbi:Uma2 family endonuclease [Sphingomonas psychrotolerans]|uniref:Uma2 family endonuclease n=1 Tax=Sphingomonas psychrotolerans TaxID=1327635 RepID=A0ABU3N8P4_9SPHN|nr:Uma2 family endonuclease [Sphingomonas psychrotolerans]MDT8760852.1 Uma2 family endonuclease [Sphingomonas psychrotolerans]
MNEQVRISSDQEWRVAFTAADFERMMRLGAFADMRAELAEGVLEKMMPALPPHGERNVSLALQLRGVLPDARFRIASDLAIRIAETTVRAADIAVYTSNLAPDRMPEGKDMLLVVEIADTTLSRDLGVKLVDYGRSGVPNYWVIDAAAQVVRVMTDPQTDGYRVQETFRFGEPVPVPGSDATITLD